jgi:hypothetical protein
MHQDDIVRLAAANNPVEAHLLRQALEEEGIRARVVGDLLDVGTVADVPGIQPEVWVHREDLEKATAVLEAHRHDAANETDLEEAAEAEAEEA